MVVLPAAFLVIFKMLFLLGLCLGSFINCLVYRLNHGLSPLVGRSFCPQCKHQLAWRDNIPLISFILLRGKCRYCHSPISVQYPLVELATGILTVSIFNFQFSIINLLIVYALIAIFVSDLRYGTIPDEIVLPAIGLSLFKANFLAGLGAAGFFLALVLITRGQGMGLGDVKLAALMGLFLGYPKIILALYLAFLTGAFFGVILILLKKKRFGEHIPFGPFLTTSTIIAIFWGEIIWQNVVLLF